MVGTLVKVTRIQITRDMKDKLIALLFVLGMTVAAFGTGVIYGSVQAKARPDARFVHGCQKAVRHYISLNASQKRAFHKMLKESPEKALEWRIIWAVAPLEASHD